MLISHSWSISSRTHVSGDDGDNDAGADDGDGDGDDMSQNL